ncbi:MAG: FAD-dependent oxidoreductase [Pseudomonadota bacterium]
MRERKLDILFEPYKMSNLTLKNRFFMAPMGTTFDLNQLTDYLVARAKGGVALITSGMFSVHPSGRPISREMPCFETDDDIPTNHPMVKAVKDAGAVFVAQLAHVGRYAFSARLGQQSVAPSPVRSRYTGETPRELSSQEVDDLVVAFAEAALRAQKSGFDGVEICANSGYLISQFLAPVTNRRGDKYGGDTPLQRATFLLSIIEETRKRVGKDFNICVKFDAEDGVAGGKTLEESLLLAPKMVEAGADRLHVWAGWHEATRPMLPMFVPRGAFSYLAAAVKKVVNVPVSTVGRINDPYVAADIVARGEADLIGLGRQLLCDPEFVKKTEEGRTSEIRRCIACCYCFDQMMRNLKGTRKVPLKCAMNPELGREGERLLRPAEKKRRVVVVGGGPAGMEAARVAAIRGHEVTLYEEDRLGGMVNLACLPPHKEELKNVVDYYTSQMKVLQVNVRLGETFTPEDLKEIQLDVVVLAAGAREFIPEIGGIEGKQGVTALDVLKGTVEVGENVVVVGGGLIGVETAEYLVDRGRKATVIEMLKSIAADVGPTTRWGLLSRIYRKMKIMKLTKVVGIKEGQVVVEDPEKNRKEIPADTVVMAAGLSSREELRPRLDNWGIEYHVIGSCREPGRIHQAVADGFHIGCQI